MYNILLAGVGGQGTVLASKLLAQCAIDRGSHVHTAETIGMAQRGGSVVSHVRIGEGVYSPLIPFRGAQLIIGFEPAEAVRVLPYLGENGALIVNTRAVKPVTDALSASDYDSGKMLDYLKDNFSRVLLFDGTGTAMECGAGKALNIALIGAAAGAGYLDFGEDELIGAINRVIPEKFRDSNMRAFKTAFAMARGKDTF